MIARRKFTTLVTALALLVLAGCSGSTAPSPASSGSTTPSGGSSTAPTQAETAQKGGNLTIGMMMTGLPTADPQKARTISDQTTARLVAEPLVMWEDGKYVGVLAERYEVSPDGLVYTFYLRKGVKYHNGKPVDAESIKQNFARITDPAKPLYAAGTLSQVQSVDVVDPSTVKITLKAVNPEFPINLANVWMVEPQAAKEMGDGFDKAPVGNGPFKVKSFVPDREIVLERNNDYWGGQALLDTITIKPIADADTLVMELRSNTVDMTTFTPMKDVISLKDAGFQMLPFVRVNLAYVTFNNKTMSDVRLRKAISYALDRNAILKTAYNGQGTLTSHIALPGSYAFNDQVKGYDYNPDQAKKILDEAGWKDTNSDGIREKDGQPLLLDFPSRGDGEWLRATQMIQQMLQQVGIGTKIRTSDANTYYSEVRTGKYDIGWWITNYSPEPPIAARTLNSKEYWFVIQVPNAKMDDLIAKGMSTLKEEERGKYFKELEQVYYDEAISWPAFWVVQNHTASSKVKGVKVTPDGIMYNGVQWTKSK